MALIGDITGLSRLQYAGVQILPERSGYSVSSRNGIVSSDVAGGISKQYIQFMNSPFTVSVTYKGLDASKAWFLSDFFDRNRGQRFICSLLIGSIDIEEFVVQRMGDYQYKATGINGQLTVTLQVVPSFDTCYADWASNAFQCVSGGDWAKIFKETKEGVEGWI